VREGSLIVIKSLSGGLGRAACVEDEERERDEVKGKGTKRKEKG
jgi:hypothetical protein